MKTIQKYFQEADKEELIRSYIFEHPIEIKSNRDFEVDGTQLGNITFENAWKFAYDRLDRLIEKIRNTNIIKTEEPMIFFAHHQVNIMYADDDIGFSLVKKSELLDPEKRTESYAYELTKIEESASYLVADTYLTELEIHSLLLEYMYEVTFFGYEQERVDEVLTSLNETTKEIEKYKDDPDHFIAAEEMFKQMEQKFGFEFEVRDEEEKAAYNKLIDVVAEYNMKAFEIEKKKVIKLIEHKGEST